MKTFLTEEDALLSKASDVKHIFLYFAGTALLYGLAALYSSSLFLSAESLFL